jgi:aminobenzoyl-glutamate utilization protein B
LLYTFHGEPAHAAVAPWRGRSALDAVELMNARWNHRGELLRTEQRSHYVITRGGDQPNVVPASPPSGTTSASWTTRHPGHVRHRERHRKAAAAMTETTVEWRIQGAAWPQHFNKPVAEAMHENMTAVGMPAWSDADLALARGLAAGAEGRGERPGDAGGQARAPRPSSPRRAAPTTSAT